MAAAEALAALPLQLRLQAHTLGLQLEAALVLLLPPPLLKDLLPTVVLALLKLQALSLGLEAPSNTVHAAFPKALPLPALLLQLLLLPLSSTLLSTSSLLDVKCHLPDSSQVLLPRELQEHRQLLRGAGLEGLHLLHSQLIHRPLRLEGRLATCPDMLQLRQCIGPSNQRLGAVEKGHLLLPRPSIS